MFTGVSAFQMGLIHIIAGMMGAGVFERHPRLKVSFAKSGAGCLAYALHRMDFEFEDRFREAILKWFAPMSINSAGGSRRVLSTLLD